MKIVDRRINIPLKVYPIILGVGSDFLEISRIFKSIYKDTYPMLSI